MPWIIYALLAAFAAALTAVLAKLGVEGTPATLAMAVRALVVTALGWTLVIVAGEQRLLAALPARTWMYLAASGAAAGCSWWAYFHALQRAPASLVAPIDKLSLPLTILLASMLLREPVSWRSATGVGLMVIGAVLTQR